MFSDDLSVIDADLSYMADTDSDDVYEAGWRVWGTCFGNAPGRWEWWPLWPLWGALTDLVDGPQDDPIRGNRLMKQAASEWIETPATDEARTEYFDRWLYEILGHVRPQPELPLGAGNGSPLRASTNRLGKFLRQHRCRCRHSIGQPGRRHRRRSPHHHD
jgi:hypothetical protein